MANMDVLKLLQLVPGNIYWKDANRVYLGCNKGLADLLHINPENIVGKTDYDLYPKEVADSINAVDDQVFLNKREIVIEEIYNKSPTEKYYFLSRKIPIYDDSGRFSGMLGISIDITNSKLLEEKLKSAEAKAEEANQLKNDFVHNMEHDIRTPFSGVYGLIAVFAEMETDPERKKYLQLIENAAKQLLDFCNSVLDFERVNSGADVILERKFEIGKLLKNVYDMELPAAILKKLEVTVNCDENIPPILIGDNPRLFRILINLVSNAIKFTEQGKVSITAKFIRQVSPKEVIIRFIVEDTGIGIDKDKEQLIYEKFVRLHPSNKGKYSGSGLGLWMVKRFLEDMGGEIDVQSKLGKGTAFYCTIPFRLPLVNEILES